LPEVPDHILRRSAEARAKAEGRDLEDVLAELKAEATSAAAAPPVPETPTAVSPAAEAPVPAAARDLEAESARYGVPVHLLERAMNARREASGTPSPAPAEAPVAPPVATLTATESVAPAPTVPEHILRRSAEFRALAEGRDVEDVLAELRAEATSVTVPTPAPEMPAPAAAPAPPATEAPAPAATRDLEAESARYGVPVHLLERAMNARRRADAIQQ